MPVSPAQKEDTQRNKAEVLRLRRTGRTFQEIGDRLGFSRQRAHKLYQQALAEIPVEAVETYRAEQRARLDALLVKAHDVLEQVHVTVQHGKVVMHDDKPVPDHGPVLDAIRAVLAIEERRAKLEGFDQQKQQVDVSAALRYEVVGVDTDALR